MTGLLYRSGEAALFAMGAIGSVCEPIKELEPPEVAVCRHASGPSPTGAAAEGADAVRVYGAKGLPAVPAEILGAGSGRKRTGIDTPQGCIGTAGRRAGSAQSEVSA